MTRTEAVTLRTRQLQGWHVDDDLLARALVILRQPAPNRPQVFFRRNARAALVASLRADPVRMKDYQRANTELARRLRAAINLSTIGRGA